jgi:signal transduction histidine kinase
MVYGTAKTLGGIALLESELGGGTKVTILLPLRQG